jgi:hypothetical protein
VFARSQSILDAVRCRRLGVARASSVLFSLAIPATEIGAWLEDDDDGIARVGFALGTRRKDIEPQLACLMQHALEMNRIELSPSERASVEARISEAMRH